jgi:hypothetical protein
MLRKRCLKVGISFALVLSIVASLACFSASAITVKPSTATTSQSLSISSFAIGDTKTATKTITGFIGASEANKVTYEAQVTSMFESETIAYDDGSYKGTLYCVSVTWNEGGFACSPLVQCNFVATFSGTVTEYA